MARPFRPIRVLSVELTDPPADITGLEDYREARVLVRLHGSPLGMLRLPVRNGACLGSAIRDAARQQLSWPITQHLLADALAAGIDDPAQVLATLDETPHQPHPPLSETLTVAVCTRDRPDDLRQCLDALLRLDPPPAEILVVDNASTSNTTKLVATAHRGVRYIREDRPGLDWARNRAILEATGAIVAFTDDDVVVDAGWAGAILRAFADRPDAVAVTGLVLPFELETEAQELFERYGGFGRGFERKWFRVDAGESAAALHGGTGKFGTGANMAFRRSAFARLGLFDPALDVGTVTNGGGDLEMFYRVMAAGDVLVYEPEAIVWHRHRREYGRLKDQLANNGIGFYSYLVRTAIAFPRERWAVLRLGVWWLWWWHLRRLMVSLYKPGAFPRDLVLTEFGGVFRGLFRYQRARNIAAAIARKTSQPALALLARPPAAPLNVSEPSSVRVVDVAVPVRDDIVDTSHAALDLVIQRGARLIGQARVENRHRPVSATQVRQVIAASAGVAVFDRGETGESVSQWAAVSQALARLTGQGDERQRQPLAPSVDVSIVVATYDRPHDLRRALASLINQRTPRRVEIVVVDNHPATGATAKVVSEFPTVRLVAERRAGLSYARNAGINASTGAIVITADDDVVAPPEWLETLVAPFADPETMIVTGNVLAADLSKPSERLFESYGGLGKGLEPLTVDGDWFWAFRHSVPTWTLGATANAAFRATIFSNPDIGLFDEALGAGTPAPCSEDTDMFYRVLRAGYRIVYEPQAFVWHHHRTTMKALRRQIMGYAKGHSAYQLKTLVKYRDRRALVRFALELPRVYVWRMHDRVFRRAPYPLRLVALEIAGTMLGPIAWWRARRRADRLGRSARYVPVAERLAAADRHAQVGAPI